MKVYLIIILGWLIMLGLVMCYMGYPTRLEISCDKEKTANFIIECARAANPMSDEEGEDLVKECGYQARKIFCEFKK